MADPKPTPAELEILDVLWSQGPATVRAVHEALKPAKSTGYTSVLKLLQIMVEKGLVVRDEAERAHVYRPAATRRQTQRRLVADLAARAFGGSAMALAMHALGSRRPTRDEAAAIRRLLDEAERRKR